MIEGKVLLNTSEGLDVAPERRGLGYVAQKDGLSTISMSRQTSPLRCAICQSPSGLTASPNCWRRPASHPSATSARRPFQPGKGSASRSRGPWRPLLGHSCLRSPSRASTRRSGASSGNWCRAFTRLLVYPLVLVTHDSEDALDVADHVVILEHGQVVQHGPIEEVFSRPARSSVARLLGIPNVLVVYSLVPENASTVRVTTNWGGLSVEAPMEPADDWCLAIPIDAILTARGGTPAVVRSCRPAAGGWRLSVTSDRHDESLEALMPLNILPTLPIIGSTMSIRIAGERGHLMPSASAHSKFGMGSPPTSDNDFPVNSANEG